MVTYTIYQRHRQSTPNWTVSPRSNGMRNANTVCRRGHSRSKLELSTQDSVEIQIKLSAPIHNKFTTDKAPLASNAKLTGI